MRLKRVPEFNVVSCVCALLDIENYYIYYRLLLSVMYSTVFTLSIG
ncbi:hypothetical protein NLO413_0618 [Candidatus Neoehrlichia lotoris str. RAC413]|uniref:Uncharacterized protein n=1 Tax=Candidatus Neoehrlichia procyonis str. RAC413 TaxID=1359163 RepID=A0A0F3NNF9_9RICK|nr:hypothetical protein NLO413_0618 [Candidatus Neoehrlichia lotoris str. RAC413]